LDSWLQNAIPIRKMFDWFFTIYQTRNSGRSWEIKEKTAEKLSHVLESKYPPVYKVLMEAKLDALGEQEAILDEKEAYLETQKNRKLLKPGQKMALHDFSHNRATSDVVPSDWDQQLTS
jgi:hypothetical protein